MALFQNRNTKAAKLTLAQVEEIRTLYRDGWTQSSLCGIFNVSVGTIGRIVRGEGWRTAGMGQVSELEAKASEDRFLMKMKQEAELKRLEGESALERLQKEAGAEGAAMLRELTNDKPPTDNAPINPLDE